MLESLLSIRHRYTKYYEGTVLKTLPCTGKASFSIGMIGNTILYAGGSADNSTYPASNPLITLSNDGLSVVSTATASGYEGTWVSGAVSGSYFWHAVGHTGSYNKTIRKRSGTNGSIIKSLNTFPGVARNQITMIDVGSNDLLIGYGYNNASSSTRDFYKFNTVSETWILLPTSPFVFQNQQGTFNKVDGKAYIGMDQDYCLIRYDPMTGEYSKTSSFSHYVRLGAMWPFQYSSVVAYGRYILIFTPNLKEGRTSEFSVLRYDTELDRFSVFNLSDFPARVAGGVIYNQVNNLIYFISGAPLHTISLEATVKFKDMLIFDAAQFLIEED